MLVNTRIQKLTTTEDKHFSRLFFNNSVMTEKLGEFSKRIRSEKKLTIADVSKNSKKDGESISPSYVNKIENEPVLNLSYPKIQALARGLGVAELEITSRISGKTPDKQTVVSERIENLKLGWSDIPDENQDEAERIIALMEREFQRLKGKK